MGLSNLRKSIFYLQQAIRNDNKNDKDLLMALDILAKKEIDINKNKEDYLKYMEL